MTALRRSLARRPSDAADLLALWLEQGHGGVEKLEALLWTCHASRRQILPSFSIDDLRGEIENNLIFAIDLPSEADAFKAALKAAKVNANTITAKMKRMTLLADLIRDSGRDWTVAFDDTFQEAVGVVAKDLTETQPDWRACRANRRGVSPS